jgi:hypothetical protein
MRSITLYFDEVVDDRQRKERKRSAKRLAFVGTAALAALLLLGQKAPGGEPTVIGVPMPILLAVPGPTARPNGSGGGEGQRPAHAAAEPPEVAFETVPVGAGSAPKLIRITSDGDEPLRIRAATVDGDAFRTTTDCTEVAKGARCAVAVVFSPRSAGPQSGLLKIRSNAETITIPLRGDAAMPASADPVAGLDFWRALPAQIAEQSSIAEQQQRHLCVAPRFVVVEPGVVQHVTVSNPGTANVRITEIRPHNASGIAIDTTDCEDRTLKNGERCVIDVNASPGAKYVELSVIDHDGDEETLRVMVSPRLQ